MVNQESLLASMTLKELTNVPSLRLLLLLCLQRRSALFLPELTMTNALMTTSNVSMTAPTEGVTKECFGWRLVHWEHTATIKNQGRLLV